MSNTLATSSDPNAPVSQEAFDALQSSHTELHPMLRDLMRVPLPAASPLASHAADPAAAGASAFVPPIPGAGVNGTSTFTAPLSLRTRFPDIEVAVIGALISHEFKVADLHKLDPTNRNKETAYTFNGTTNQSEGSHSKAFKQSLSHPPPSGGSKWWVCE
ncbi:hypothetical protein E4T56_gene951 [Termitomyces sp. T112]|nr:hypothetical protein E4T56_gene951 [Termitomyces sp. T112]